MMTTAVPLVGPVADSDAVDKAAQAFERIREVLNVEDVPVVFRYLANVPAFVHDYFMNFRKFVLGDGKLDSRTRLLIALTVAGNAGSGPWIRFLTDHATRAGISSQEIADAMAVAATNSMYNALFKFKDISGTDVFDGMGVGLRAHTFQATSLAEKTVELINIVLSNLNACKPCTSAHVSKARTMGVSDEALFEAIQCGATIVSGAQFLRSIGVEEVA